MTDNGPCYKAKDFATTCKALGLKHIRTKPYTPKTNGKAERFIQTALREWAYACAYPSSESSARKPEIKNTHQSPRPQPRQPLEDPQLELLRSGNRHHPRGRRFFDHLGLSA